MKIDGVSVETLDRQADQFEAIIEKAARQALNEAATKLGDTLDQQASTTTVSQADVNVIFREWQTRLDEDVLPALQEIWAESANHQQAQLADIPGVLTAAIDMPDTSINPTVDQPPPPPRVAPAFVSTSEAAVSATATARNQLVGIGDEIWAAARVQLTEGMFLGESVPHLATRVRQSIDVSLPRSRVIARTEANKASNAGSIHAMRSTEGLVSFKTWLATMDTRTRPDHLLADGQQVPLDEPFTVGGSSLDHPGDPAGPPEQVINCRCTLTYEVDAVNPEALVAATVEARTGMIALRPENPAEFVIDGGETEQELHVTLSFLGDNVSSDLEVAAKEAADMAARQIGEPFTVRVAGWGVLGDEDAVVLFLNGEGLERAHTAVMSRIASEPELHEQFAPWIPHMTLGYGIDPELAKGFTGQEFTVNQLSTDIGGNSTRYVIGPEADTLSASIGEETAMADEPTTARWRGVMVVEDTPTGDGRQFAADALTWPEMPLPLQWQKETTHGGMNDVVVTVGTIDSVKRQGSRLVGEGMIDLGSDDGREAYRRIDELGLGGVSIVADDPEQADVEYVFPEHCAEIEEKTEEEIESEVPIEDLMSCFIPELVIYHSGRIRALTIVDTPAFVEAKIEIVDEAEVTAAVNPMPVSLTVGQQTIELGKIESVADLKALLADASGVDSSEFTAVARHETATSDSSWDGPANEARLESPMTTSTAEDAYAWIDGDEVEDGEVTKSACKFIHHEVSSDGDPGAANIRACQTGIGVLNGARGGTTVPDSDKQGVYDHLAGHIRDAGLEPPELASVVDEEIIEASNKMLDELDAAYAEADEALTAAAYTVTLHDTPPLEWFDEPDNLPDIGGIKVTDDGRFFGLLAPSGVAHRGFEHRVEVPMRNVDYSRFMNRATKVTMADGSVEDIPTGVITMNCGHASTSPSVNGSKAMEHYDNACSIVANVRVGENKHGVWVAGALLPGIDEDQLTRLLSSQLSGDWRPLKEQPGMRELTAALLVPVPGFAASGPTVRIAEGELVAATAPVEFVSANDVDSHILKLSDLSEVTYEVVEDEATEKAEGEFDPFKDAREAAQRISSETTAETEPPTDLPEPEDFNAESVADAHYIEDLPDVEETLKQLDPMYKINEYAEQRKQEKLAAMVASVKGSQDV